MAAHEAISQVEGEALRPSAPVIGLVGGIGSGKSQVDEILRQLGCLVTNSDADVRVVLGRAEVRDELVAWWGVKVLDGEGRINREAVADIVFQDEHERRKLEGLIHPHVEAMRRSAWQQEAARRAVPAFVIDAPLLLEAGLKGECDAVLLVEAGYDVRLERLTRTRGWDAGRLDRREKWQWSLDNKRQWSDYSVDNNGDVEALRQRVETVFNRILGDYQRGEARRGGKS